MMFDPLVFYTISLIWENSIDTLLFIVVWHLVYSTIDSSTHIKNPCIHNHFHSIVIDIIWILCICCLYASSVCFFFSHLNTTMATYYGSRNSWDRSYLYFRCVIINICCYFIHFCSDIKLTNTRDTIYQEVLLSRIVNYIRSLLHM